MIETQAWVRALNADGSAQVEPQPHSPCGQCDPVNGCKTLQMSRMFSSNKQTFRVENPINAKIGDPVIVGIHDGLMLKSAAYLYALPLLALVLGAGVGQLWSDAWAMLLGFGLTGLVFLGVRHHLNQQKQMQAPSIIEIVNPLDQTQERLKTCPSKNLS